MYFTESSDYDIFSVSQSVEYNDESDGSSNYCSCGCNYGLLNYLAGFHINLTTVSPADFYSCAADREPQTTTTTTSTTTASTSTTTTTTTTVNMKKNSAISVFFYYYLNVLDLHYNHHLYNNGRLDNGRYCCQDTQYFVFLDNLHNIHHNIHGKVS